MCGFRTVGHRRLSARPAPPRPRRRSDLPGHLCEPLRIRCGGARRSAVFLAIPRFLGGGRLGRSISRAAGPCTRSARRRFHRGSPHDRAGVPARRRGRRCRDGSQSSDPGRRPRPQHAASDIALPSARLAGTVVRTCASGRHSGWPPTGQARRVVETIEPAPGWCGSAPSRWRAAPFVRMVQFRRPLSTVRGDRTVRPSPLSLALGCHFGMDGPTGWFAPHV